MIEEMKESTLKEAYLSLSEGITNIEYFLSKVESEDMSYDLNRQCNDYHTMANLCKEELQREGESLLDVAKNLSSQQSNYSFQHKTLPIERSGGNTDQMIVRNVVKDITKRVNMVRNVTNNSPSEAVSSIAMKIIEEEEKHMGWMKSYMDERFLQ